MYLFLLKGETKSNVCSPALKKNDQFDIAENIN